jgi:hypothetical protein
VDGTTTGVKRAKPRRTNASAIIGIASGPVDRRVAEDGRDATGCGSKPSKNPQFLAARFAEIAQRIDLSITADRRPGQRRQRRYASADMYAAPIAGSPAA